MIVGGDRGGHARDVGVVSFARIVREQHEAEAARALAEHKRALADDRRAAAEGLVTFMLGDLRSSLEPIGKLALLELPARKALAYFDARRELAPDERESRAVALENLGDALRVAAISPAPRPASVRRSRRGAGSPPKVYARRVAVPRRGVALRTSATC